MLQWLKAQSASKLGKPFAAGLLGLATMWAEIQNESETARLEAEEEAQRRKEAKLERKRAQAEEEARMAAEADAKAAKRREEAELRGEVPGEEVEVEEVEESSSEDSATKERRGLKQAPRFDVANGIIPPLKNLCIKSFGDNLLLFEGFDEVPIQIRAKVFLYLVESRTLSHRKLTLLVGEDQKRLDLNQCRL